MRTVIQYTKMLILPVEPTQPLIVRTISSLRLKVKRVSLKGKPSAQFSQETSFKLRFVPHVEIKQQNVYFKCLVWL